MKTKYEEPTRHTIRFSLYIVSQLGCEISFFLYLATFGITYEIEYVLGERLGRQREFSSIVNKISIRDMYWMGGKLQGGFASVLNKN